MTTELEFQKEVIDKFKDIDKRLDDWREDMNFLVDISRKQNDALRDLLQALKNYNGLQNKI